MLPRYRYGEEKMSADAKTVSRPLNRHMALLFLSHNKWRLKKDMLPRLEIAFTAGV